MCNRYQPLYKVFLVAKKIAIAHYQQVTAVKVANVPS
jgi:hypothetical protein